MKQQLKNFVYWIPLNILLITTSCYISIRFAEHDKYCIEMPRQDLDYTREHSKTWGDKNEIN